MRITTKQSRGWIVALGATPLLALMLSVGIGHADSRMRGGNPGGGHERGSAGSWSGGRGGSSWRGGGNGGRDYSRGGSSGGGSSRGGYSGGGYSRGGYSGGYSRGGYPGGGYSRGGDWGRVRYRPDYGGRGYSGGYRRYGPRGYYYPRSRSYVHFGIGFGYPYYGDYGPTRVVVARPVRTILIANYPPSGCYYYDPYCDMRFDCLDDYYEHMQDCGHDATLEVIDGSGDCVGTYGYVNGEWTIEN